MKDCVYMNKEFKDGVLQCPRGFRFVDKNEENNRMKGDFFGSTGLSGNWILVRDEEGGKGRSDSLLYIRRFEPKTIEVDGIKINLTIDQVEEIETKKAAKKAEDDKYIIKYGQFMIWDATDHTNGISICEIFKTFDLRDPVWKNKYKNARKATPQEVEILKSFQRNG